MHHRRSLFKINIYLGSDLARAPDVHYYSAAQTRRCRMMRRDSKSNAPLNPPPLHPSSKLSALSARLRHESEQVLRPQLHCIKSGCSEPLVVAAAAAAEEEETARPRGHNRIPVRKTCRRHVEMNRSRRGGREGGREGDKNWQRGDNSGLQRLRGEGGQGSDCERRPR